ncbi:MAG TPA: ABC transporter ATP-binding protein [Methanoregula sp.]|nr:ABC transporter ATP-binding protein [Methanoregula sp.]
MIEITSVNKVFASRGSEIRAVNIVTISVREGDFVLILGRSGSGKSTLLGMFAGLIRPTSGRVSVRGKDINSLSEDQVAELRAREIGFVFQFSGLIPTLTAIENVLLPTLFRQDNTADRDTAHTLLGKVGILDRANAYPATLSSGEMKRVAIARALVNSPSILIADEPTGDLDVDTENEIMALFRQLNQEGITIVMVTHNPDLIPCATQIYRMDHGMLEKVSGSPSCDNRKPVSGPAVTGGS